jgi:hypothetical protein
VVEEGHEGAFAGVVDVGLVEVMHEYVELFRDGEDGQTSHR